MQRNWIKCVVQPLLGLLAVMAAGVAMAAGAATSDVSVSQAWIRATVKGQTTTGGSMTLLSAKGAVLMGFSTAVAHQNLLHEMSMAGDVMRMREVSSVALPAGQAVDFQPGGRHLMLTGLRRTLKVGDQVPVVLKLKAHDGHVYTQTVTVPVRLTP